MRYMCIHVADMKVHVHLYMYLHVYCLRLLTYTCAVFILIVAALE